jgi:hypothetical protein
MRRKNDKARTARRAKGAKARTKHVPGDESLRVVANYTPAHQKGSGASACDAPRSHFFDWRATGFLCVGVESRRAGEAMLFRLQEDKGFSRQQLDSSDGLSGLANSKSKRVRWVKRWRCGAHHQPDDVGGKQVDADAIVASQTALGSQGLGNFIAQMVRTLVASLYVINRLNTSDHRLKMK